MKLPVTIIIFVSFSLANERFVQVTHKQAQVRKSYKEKKVGILRADRSIQKVKYKFKLSNFIQDNLKKPNAINQK